MAITFVRQSVAMDGVTVLGDVWTDGTTEMQLAAGATQAAAEAAFGVYTKAAEQETLKSAPKKSPDMRLTGDGAILIMDENGDPLLRFRRGADGGVDVIGLDRNGNGVSYTKSQVITMSFRGTKVATAAWPVAFARVPSVSLTLLDASSTVPYKVSASKTGVTIRFQNAYAGSCEVHGAER